ncbi:MAG: hypothetical protein CL506_00825 [Actinobacteria bacterium]|jgi:hypothetical protein|nr:hypothetical protein [Actinomycetota bacterium]
MRKVFFALFLIIFSLSCSNSSDEPAQVDTIYSMDDASKLGIKNLMKNDFETEFPEATDAKWGFWKGREVAILRYESVEKARTLGKTAAEEQTELIEVVEKNIAHGTKVEKTKCRGDAYGGTPYRLSPKYNIGIGGTLILNKSSFKDLDVEIGTNSVRDGCVRREPMFIEFRIHGNLVIMVEPMPEEDRPAMNKIIDEIVAKLP